jgi:hypothetical protein
MFAHGHLLVVWWGIFQYLVARLPPWSHARCFLTIGCFYVTGEMVFWYSYPTFSLLVIIYPGSGWYAFIKFFRAYWSATSSLTQPPSTAAGASLQSAMSREKFAQRNWVVTSQKHLASTSQRLSPAVDGDLCRRFGLNILERVSCYWNPGNLKCSTPLREQRSRRARRAMESKQSSQELLKIRKR